VKLINFVMCFKMDINNDHSSYLIIFD